MAKVAEILRDHEAIVYRNLQSNRVMQVACKDPDCPVLGSMEEHYEHVEALMLAEFGNLLDPGRVEAALRELIAHVDYDTHKYIECDEDDGKDHYPELTRDFITYYEKAETDG